MSLVTATSRKEPARVVSGPGSEILRTIVRPWLRSAVEYDRVSSYFGPRSLLTLLREFANVWRTGGVVRLVIGYHDSAKIVAALQEEDSPSKALIHAVTEVIRGDAEELGRLIREHGPEIIPALRALMQERAFHVRLVTPKSNLRHFERRGKWPDPSEAALFHSKFAIYWQGHRKVPFARRREGGYYRSVRAAKDAGERWVSVNGSFNESERAYGKNIEDAVTHRSWVAGEDEVALYFAQRFEDLWANSSSDVESMPFDSQFSDALGLALERANPKWLGWAEFSDFVQRSPWYDSLAIKGVGLLPHQQRVASLALSRWPIRAILADEVGLGKTVEAGVVVRYLLAHKLVRRVLILTPASLRQQWQRELKRRFGLQFWLFDPSSGTCKLGGQEKVVGDQPLDYCELVIASWHWARLEAEQGAASRIGAHPPDLLIVDEAHHARLHEGTGGETSATLLFTFLQSLGQTVPHVLLLTATPFQTAQLDYWSLLSLVGLPEWLGPAELGRFAQWSQDLLPDNYSLRVRLLDEVRRTAGAYDLKSYPKSEVLASLPQEAPTPRLESALDSAGPLTKKEYLSVHPSTLLTLRNTRAILKGEGYHFPRATVTSVPMTVTEAQKHWLREFEAYVREDLGKAEARTNGSQVLGRMKSGFRQRAVSSIRAARNSLLSRRETLNVFVGSDDSSELETPENPDLLEEDMDEIDGAARVRMEQAGSTERAAQRHAALTERIQVDHLLASLKIAFSAEGHDMDPKMVAIKALVREHLAHKRRVLIFSRFTSTTESVVEALADIPETLPIGRYDGGVVGFYDKKLGRLTLEEAERSEIERSLRRGKLRVLVCSDAASEGLDLQAACVVINVDVPWNPARVIQRFGRVDRLGQKAPEVFLVNAYYPGTIEERMYSVLEDRRMTGVAMLGELVEVLSDRQRQFTQYLLDGSPQPAASFEEMENARREYARGQFAQISLHSSEGSRAKDLFKGFVSAIERDRDITVDSLSLKVKGGSTVSIDPMEEDFVSWSEPYWARFEAPVKRKGIEAEVVCLEGEHGTPLVMAVIHNSRCYPIHTERWPELFSFIFHGDPIDLGGWKHFGLKELEMAHDFVKSGDEWVRPVAERMSTISKVRPVRPEFEVKRLKKLGRRVRVTA